MDVREAAQANCAIFQRILDRVMRLERIESDPDLSAGQKASEGFGSLENSPWPEGPPLATRVSLLPFQSQIGDLYGKGMVRLELLQKNRGLSLEG